MSLHHGLRSAAGASADPDFKNVSLLLLGNGTNGGQNNTFVDDSSNAFSITRYGNTTQGTFSPFGYNWSNYFDGNGDYLSAPASSAFAFGTGALTVEAWIYLTAYPSGYFCVATNRPYNSGNNNTWLMLVLSDGTLRFGDSLGGVSLDSTTKLQLNRWYHIAACRVSTSSNQTFVFINGTVEATGTVTYDFSTTTNTLVCGWSNDSTAGNYLAGYLSNLRILKGTAQYNAAFTPPTAPLTAITNTSLLTCQSNRFLDNSSNAFTITPYGDAKVTNFAPFATGSEYSTGTNGGSGYFDGTGDYLTAGAAADWKFLHDGSDWSIEFWVYHSTTNLKAIASTTWWTGEIGMSVLLNLGTVNTVSAEFYRGVGGSLATFTSSANLSTNQWNHVAITFSSSGKTCSFYINGASAGSSSNTGFSYSSSNPTNTLAIGRAQGSGGANTPGGEIIGFIGSLRISSNIRTGLTTVPTTPFASDANTKLLLNWTNAAIIDSTGKNDLETVGDAQISTSTKKFGTGSLKFDGTGDRLSIPDSSLWDFGTGDFTVEGWFNFSSTSSVMTLVCNYDYPSSSGWVMQWRNDNGTFNFGYFETGLISYTWTPTTGTWYHLAVCRSGTNLRQFIDGTQVGSTVTNSTNISGSSNALLVGALYYSPLSSFLQYYNGYIDDLRISKVARYSSAFTPPSRQLPAR